MNRKQFGRKCLRLPDRRISPERDRVQRALAESGLANRQVERQLPPRAAAAAAAAATASRQCGAQFQWECGHQSRVSERVDAVAVAGSAEWLSTAATSLVVPMYVGFFAYISPFLFYF